MKRNNIQTLSIFHRSRLIDESTYTQVFNLLHQRKILVESILNINTIIENSEAAMDRYEYINSDICKLLAIS